MTPSPAPNAERWLWEQKSIITELFESAADELESAGVRLRAGSSPPVLEDMLDGRRIRLTPTRLSQLPDGGAFALTLLATVKGGPHRYEIILEISGAQPLEALKHLGEAHAEVWQRVYLRNGLWLVQGGNIDSLNEIQQLMPNQDPNLAIVAAFLHSELPRTIIEGAMLLGTLYRCIFDELCGVTRMTKLCNLLANKLGGRIPRLHRDVRPSIQ